MRKSAEKQRIALITTDAAVFKAILKSCPVDRKWFLWHLASPLHQYNLYALKIKNEIIGAAAVSADYFGDILIYESFKNQGYGKEVINMLKQDHFNMQFKVNVFNKSSLLFFDSLMQKGIITSKHFDGHFYNYK